MNSLFKIVCAISLSMLSANSAARSYVNYACNEEEESTSILPCSQSKRIASDQNLNQRYIEARERIKKHNKSDDVFLNSYLDRLKNSQRAWIKLRDENCELEAFEFELGSVLDNMARNLCVAGMSDERASFLGKVGKD